MDKKKIRKLIFFCSLIFLFLFSNPFLTLVHAQTEQTTDNHVEKTITQAFGFIATQMNPDGGIRWVDETSSMGATLRAVWALAAAGYSQDYLKHESGNRPIDFLANASSAWVNQAESEKPGFSVARAGQLLTAIAAANENPHYFGLDARDFLYEININYDPTNGIYGDSISENVVDQLWAMIGLAANNASVPEKAVNWLTSTQLADGSWNDGYGNYLDTTPLAVLALLSSEHRAIDATEILSAFAYLQKNQHLNGGWQTVWDTQTNASTSSSVLQAINASGQEPKSANWQREEGQPLTALLNLAQSNGAIGGDFTNAYSTADAIVGLSGKWVTRLGDVENASEAINYLISKQESSGGWGSIGQTIDVLLALHAIGWEPNTVVTSDATPLQAISGDLNTYLESGPDAVGKAILGLTALGENPLNFEGNDLHQRLMAYYDETSQAFGSPENSWHQAFSILGLHALGVDIPQGAVQTLINLQQNNGGWEYTPGLGTWPDHTALAIQALLASGQLSGSVKIKHALAYIRSMQLESGGWGDASTTAYVITTLNALDESSENWITDVGKSPRSDLFSYQRYNGAFVFSWEYPEDNLMSTATALLAIYGDDFILSFADRPKTNFAIVFVDPGISPIQSACVEFSGETISGLELLDSSGFSYDYQEGFINQILEISNQEGETNYWSFWRWDGRDWEFYNTGIAETIIQPGSIQAWYFTSWERFPSLPPDFTPNIEYICPDHLLVNFTDQPYIDFNNLFSETFDEDKFSEPVIKSLEQERQKSSLPISFFVALGSILFIAMIVVLIKRNK